MTTVNAPLKIGIVVASGSVMLVFAEVTLAILIPFVVGIALIIMALAIEYRSPAVVGLLTVLTVSALAIDVTTLTDAGNVFAATVSLFVPALLLTWAALSAEPGDAYVLRLRTKPFGRFILIAVACVLSIPLFALALSVLLPGVSMRISTMAEMSVLLFAISTAAFLLARSSPEPLRTEAEEGLSAE